MNQIEEATKVVREARAYCLRYGAFLPAGEFKDGYTAHNECPPHKHVYVIERDSLSTIISRVEELERERDEARNAEFTTAQFYDQRDRVEALEAALRDCTRQLQYAARPTMGLPWDADPAEWAQNGATNEAVRLALVTCIVGAQRTLNQLTPEQDRQAISKDREK